MTSPQMTSTSRSMATRCLAMAAVALGLFGAPVVFSQTASTAKPAAKPAAAAVPPHGASAFPTAQAAASALIQAAVSRRSCSRLSERRMRRETCICETPTRRAISVCVRSSTKRR